MARERDQGRHGDVRRRRAGERPGRRAARHDDGRVGDERSGDGAERRLAEGDDGGEDAIVAVEAVSLDEPLFGPRVEAVLDTIRPHLRAVGLAAIGLLLVGAAWSFVSAQRVATRRQSWDAYLEAMNGSRADALADLDNRFPGTPAAAWARLALAENSLGEGTELAFVDKDGSRIRLESAVDQYTALLAGRPDGMLAERITLGLAKARESLGQLDEARSGYEAVAKDHPFSAVAAMATEHARTLSDPQTREWYGWFTSWKPPVASPPASGGSSPPGESTAPGAGVAPPGTPAAEPTAPAPPPTE